MRRRTSPEEALFDFRYIDAAEVGQHNTLIDDISARRIDGAIVRNALSKETLDVIKERLAKGTVPFAKRTFNGFPEGEGSPYTLGRAIVSASHDLVEYFDTAKQTRGNLREIFAGAGDFEARMAEIFGALANGRPVAVPEGPNHETYAPATFRFLPEGRDIGIHVGNSFLRLPQARHLSTLVDLVDQLSFFITVQAPEGGGELVVYGLEWDDVASQFPAELGPDEMVYDSSGVMIRLVELCAKQAFAPSDGDLLIFDGGRFYHRVAHILGKTPRCTLGGFLSFSRDNKTLCYWS